LSDRYRVATFRAEKLDVLSCDCGIEVHRVAAWTDEFLKGEGSIYVHLLMFGSRTDMAEPPTP
jgi:hypothetical protein